MNKTVSTLIALVFVIVVSLSGCVNIHLVSFKDNAYFNDLTDNGDRKGYVEFYIGDSSDLMIAKVYKLVEKSPGGNIWSGDRRLLGLLGQYNRATKIFVTEKPGTYTYLVKKETSVSTVNVIVHEGMLTRARVIINTLCEEEVRNRGGEKVLIEFFDINVTTEPPIPFKSKVKQ